MARCLSSHRLLKQQKEILYDLDSSQATILLHLVTSIHPARRTTILTPDSSLHSSRTLLLSLTTRLRMLASHCGSTGMSPDLDETIQADSEHSRQKDECKQGMVFAINPKDQDQFHQFSMKATTFGSNQANSTVNNSNGTTIHTLNLTTSTTVHLTNTTTTNVTQKATPMRLRNRRGFAGRA